MELKDKPEKAWMGGEKASRGLSVPERIYSQLGKYFGVAGKGGSWNRKIKKKKQQKTPQEAKQGGKGADESEGQ